MKVFETPSLNHKKYSAEALENAIKSLSYKDIIANYPSLSLKDEQTLFELYQNKDNRRAFQILFLSNVYLIPYMSKRWRGIIAEEDLYLSQEDTSALLVALTIYDYKKEIRFVTYLYRKGYINLAKKIVIKTDGASRGNPGPSALGLEVLHLKRNLIYADSSYLGDHKTNNFSEYKAVIRALELINTKGLRRKG